MLNLATLAVVVPLNVLFQAHDIAYHLQDSDASAYICFEGSEPLPTGRIGYAALQDVDTCKHFVMLANNPELRQRLKGITVLNTLMADQPATFDTAQTSPATRP